MAKNYERVCPCKGCKEREIGCHTFCEEYKEWKDSGTEIKVELYYDFSKASRRKRK